MNYKIAGAVGNLHAFSSFRTNIAHFLMYMRFKIRKDLPPTTSGALVWLTDHIAIKDRVVKSKLLRTMLGKT